MGLGKKLKLLVMPQEHVGIKPEHYGDSFLWHVCLHGGWKPGSSESQSCSEKLIPSLAILWVAREQRQHPQSQKTLQAQRRRAMDQAAWTHAQGSSPASLRWQCAESKSSKCLLLSLSGYQAFTNTVLAVIPSSFYFQSCDGPVLKRDQEMRQRKTRHWLPLFNLVLWGFLISPRKPLFVLWLLWILKEGICEILIWAKVITCILKHTTFAEQLGHSRKFCWKATWYGLAALDTDLIDACLKLTE